MADVIAYRRDQGGGEPFLVRLCGGPACGDRLVYSNDMPWPLPDVFDAASRGGAYRKVSESQLAPQRAGSGVVRGAEYVWIPS